MSRITTNAFLDEVRRRKRRPLEIVPDLPERAIGVDADPEEVLSRSRLPSDVQDAALDIPPGTVRSRIHRARAQLRKALVS